MKKVKCVLISLILAFTASLSLGVLSACHTHEYGEWVTVTEATCTVGGEKQRVCSCGDKQTEAIPALGHDKVQHNAQEATCEEKGWNAYETCTRCDYTTYEEIPALGHDYGGDNVCDVCKKYFSDGLEFTLNEDKQSYSVTGIGSATDKNLFIPAIYNSLPVTEIGYMAFYNCNSLTDITIPDSVIVIEKSAFDNCNGLTSITISSSLTTIGTAAFRFCMELTSVTIPNSVTAIGDWAFDHCTRLKEVSIGSSVTSIGSYVFYNCKSLTNITVDEENVNYKSIDGNLYSKDGTVLVQYAIGKTSNSFIIPDSVTTISDYAFRNCTNLTNLTIPNSVTVIEGYAFTRCDQLTSINFTGTMEEWKNVDKNYNWNSSTADCVVICTDGTLDKSGTVVNA